MVPYLICRMAVLEVGPLKNCSTWRMRVFHPPSCKNVRERDTELKRDGTEIYLKICYNKRMEQIKSHC